MEQVIEKARVQRFSQDRWNEMRRRLEEGEALIPVTERPAPVAERKVLPAPPPLGPGLNVVLPYESGLSISGRKVIDFKLESTIFAEPDLGKGRVNKTDFQLDQQLQVRVKGTVGRKVTVNVDFDDTREDKRDISVVYKGDPDEVLQEAAFGDITISLPSTEFVQYSKSVFGARAELMFKPRTGLAKMLPTQLWHRYTPKQWKTFLIGSRTKGITQTKRFTGQTLPQRKNLEDIRYARRKFYFLAFSTQTTDATNVDTTEHRPIVPDSERIFIDDQDSTNFNINDTTRTFLVPTRDTLLKIDGLTPATSNYIGPTNETNVGVFRQLIRGVDYTVDYVKGVVQFKRTINKKDIIVADYIPQNSGLPISQTNNYPALDGNGRIDPKVQNAAIDVMRGFKPILLKPDETQFFANRELKNYYELGDKRIVRDDGRGNFILRILDLNNAEPSVIASTDPVIPSKTVPRYPNNIEMDFENGIITFVSSDVLRSPNPRPFPDDLYYFNDDVPSFKKNYNIFVEYRFRRGNFSLDQSNILSLSEQVFVDGKKMTRDVDYFIDYDVGIVSFFRPDTIRDDSIIEITYDFSPFGGQGEETVVGVRNEIYGTDNFFVGNSVLYNFQPRAQGVPDLRSVTRSILVMEADLNWKDVKFSNYEWARNFDFFNLPGLRNLNLANFPFEMTTFSAEYARSIKNPNTADKAMIQSFEGIKIEDSASLNKDSWQIAATPERGNPIGGGAFQKGHSSALTLTNEDVRITDVNPNAPSESSDRIQVLNLNYDLSRAGQYEATSIAQSFSRAGVDFFSNRRQFLEVWVFGNNQNESLLFRLGNIAEDADRNGILGTEDANRNGTLGPGEDIGWAYSNPDTSSGTIGAGNARLDTEDLDVNGRLDPDDQGGNYLQESSVTVNFNGWRIIQLPLNIPATAQAEWSSVKDVRVTVVNPNTTPLQGQVKIGKISVVGTRLEPATVDPSTVGVTGKIYAENNLDSPSYPTLANTDSFKELYEVENETGKRREQGLAIEYQRTLAAGTPDVVLSTVSTREVFPTRALDISDHRNLRFYVYTDGTDLENDVFMRIGSPNNYLEYRANLGLFAPGWNLVEIDILDQNRDGVLDNLASFNNQLVHTILRPYNGRWNIVGSPSIKNITEIVSGVYVKGGGVMPQGKKIYINEIHVQGSVKSEGEARRVNSDFVWKNWGTFGARWRLVDGNFQTLTTQNSGQDEELFNAYMNVNRFKFIPTNMSYSLRTTSTKKIQQVVDPNVLISILDEDKNTTQNKTLSGNFLMTQLPYLPGSIRSRLLNFDYSYDFSLTERSNDRSDERENYRVGTSYGLPWQPDILPTRFFTFKPLPTSVSAGYSRNISTLRLVFDNSDIVSTGEDYSLSSSFQPFSRLSFSPRYKFARTIEKLRPFNRFRPMSEENTLNIDNEYYRTQAQNVAMSGNLRVFSWLAPSFSYNIDTSENYNVNNVVFGSTDSANVFLRGRLKSINRSSSGDVSANFAPKDVFQYIRYLRAANVMINSLSFSGGYNISDADTYENVTAGYRSMNTLNRLIIRGQALDIDSSTTTNARRTSLTATDTSRVSGRWNPFEGFTFLKHRLWQPMKNINVSGSFTESLTYRDTTGTQNKTYSRVWPDFQFSTTELEKLLFLRRWMSDTRLNTNYQERITEDLGQRRTLGLNMGSDFTFTLFRLLQFSVNYINATTEERDLRIDQVTARTRSNGFGGQVITTLKWGNWRFTPRYDQSQSEAEDGTGRLTSDLVTRNMSLQIFGDINIPRFFQLPFGKQLNLSNRLILTSNLRYGMVRDGVDETKSVDNASADLTGDFEVTPNIRVAFGGGFTRSMRKTKKEEDFTTINFTSRVTIQF